MKTRARPGFVLYCNCILEDFRHLVCYCRTWGSVCCPGVAQVQWCLLWIQYTHSYMFICKSFYQNILNRPHLSNRNGSVQWEMIWCEKVANVGHCSQTVATEIYLFLNFAPVFSSMYFRFRKTTRRFLGPLDNVRRFVQNASHFKHFFCLQWPGRLENMALMGILWELLDGVG